MKSANYGIIGIKEYTVTDLDGQAVEKLAFDAFEVGFNPMDIPEAFTFSYCS